MADLAEYVVAHTERGECHCGLCIDRGDKPDPKHSIDNGFFRVALKDAPELATFLALTQSWHGEFTDVDPLDGQEHSYIEIGGWLGDQGLALSYMALGHMLEAFTLLTPRSMLGDAIDDQAARQMAGMGLVTVKATV